MAKKSSPLANMMAGAVQPEPAPAGIPFTKGVAAPPPKKATPGKAPGVGRGNMANFKGRHAAPFGSKKK